MLECQQGVPPRRFFRWLWMAFEARDRRQPVRMNPMDKYINIKSAVTESVAIASDAFQRQSTAPQAAPGQLKFLADNTFYRKVQQRIDEHFKCTGKRQRDCPRMYLKTTEVLAWFVSSYALLVFSATTWWCASRSRHQSPR